MVIELHPHLMKEKNTIFVLRTILNGGFKTKKIIRRVTLLEMKVTARNQFDYSYNNISDLLNDQPIISGKLGAFEIFFERK